jgi:hypothetical protein
MSKRKWDQTGDPAEEGPSKVSKVDEGKSASEAAAAAVSLVYLSSLKRFLCIEGLPDL